MPGVRIEKEATVYHAYQCYYHVYMGERADNPFIAPEGFFTSRTRRGYRRRFGYDEVTVTADRADKSFEFSWRYLGTPGIDDPPYKMTDMPIDVYDQVFPGKQYRKSTVERGILALVNAYADWHEQTGPVKNEPSVQTFLNSIGPHLKKYFPK